MPIHLFAINTTNLDYYSSYTKFKVYNFVHNNWAILQFQVYPDNPTVPIPIEELLSEEGVVKPTAGIIDTDPVTNLLIPAPGSQVGGHVDAICKYLLLLQDVISKVTCFKCTSLFQQLSLIFLFQISYSYSNLHFPDNLIAMKPLPTA